MTEPLSIVIAIVSLRGMYFAGNGTLHAALSGTAFGRSTTARRGCPRLGWIARSRAGRRTAGNLNLKSGEAVVRLLQELHHEGATICIVTHDAFFAAYTERQLLLFDGQVISDGPSLEQ